MNVDEEAQLNSVQKRSDYGFAQDGMRWWLKSWSEAISGLHMKRPRTLGRAAKSETLLRRTYMAKDDGQTCPFPT